MTGKGYTAINIPKGLADEIDHVIKRHYFKSRDDFVRYAIRRYVEFLHTHKKD